MNDILSEKPLSVVIHGNCVEVFLKATEGTVDAIVTDPPYGLGFMDKEFDKLGKGAAQQAWHARWLAAAFHALKPGGYLLAFGGTRTYHRLACAAEDVGFEIRDCIQWVYGSGFPKSKSVAMSVDKHLGKIGHRGKAFTVAGDVSHLQSMEGKAGAVGQHDGLSPEAQRWQGWQTALKPAQEPILVARKPLEGTVAANVLKHGTGAINVDACRVGGVGGTKRTNGSNAGRPRNTLHGGNFGVTSLNVGRWPANLILSHTEECRHDGVKVAGSGRFVAHDAVVRKSPMLDPGKGWNGNNLDNSKKNAPNSYGTETVANWTCAEDCPVAELDRQWSDASRFFYTPKASKREREAGCEDLPGAQQDATRKPGSKGGNNPRNRGAKQRKNHHPTVKPIAIMEYLLKLVVPPDGVVVDPFLGSGTTLVAAARLGVRAIGIERESAYIDIAKARIAHTLKGE